MKYYLIKITDIENEVIEYKAYSDMRSAKRYMKSVYRRPCAKHIHGDVDAECICKRFSLFHINEKLVDKKEFGNV